MPQLDFGTETPDPVHVGEITLVIKERFFHIPVVSQKTDGQGNRLFLDADGNETTKEYTVTNYPDTMEDIVFKNELATAPVKDEDGSTNKVIEADGYVEAGIIGDTGLEIAGSKHRFQYAELPITTRRAIMKLFENDLRKKFAAGMGVRERE